MTWACRFSVICLLLLSASSLAAEPTFEFGAGVVGSWRPDYPAAAQSHFQWIPFPVIIYRSKYFTSDVGSVSGKVTPQPWIQLDLSLAASFSADSEKNTARVGMPNLDYLVEAGPQIKLLLLPSRKVSSLEIHLPFRAVFSTNFKNFKYRGYLAQPGIHFIQNHFPWQGSHFRISVSSLIASSRLHGYFYNVEPQYVTVSRPAYQSSDGYLGSELNIVQRFRFFRHSLFFSYTLSSHHHAVNQESPLFRERWTHIYTVGLIFIFFHTG